MADPLTETKPADPKDHMVPEKPVCDLSTQCPQCDSKMEPEHAHYRCPKCGYRDSCCF